MARSILAGFFLLCPLLNPVTATSYSLVKEYAGPTFFDDWTFYNNCALSHLDSFQISIAELLGRS